MSAQWRINASTHAACAVAGPPTRNAWIHVFDCARAVIVKLPVGCLPGLSGPEIEIGFVPNLEIPLRNFIDTVAIDQMLRKRGIRSSHLAQSFGGETFGLYQKVCRLFWQPAFAA